MPRDRSISIPTQKRDVPKNDDNQYVDAALAEEAAVAIEQLEDVVIDVQQTLAERPPQADPGETVSEVAKIVDSPKQRAAQGAAVRAVAKIERATRKRR
jgi:hypothetical protein